MGSSQTEGCEVIGIRVPPLDDVTVGELTQRRRTPNGSLIRCE